MSIRKDPSEYLPLTPLWFQILVVLGEGHSHGYGVIKKLEDRLGDFSTATGPVYLALRRMTEEGLIAEAAAPPSVDSRRKHYGISPLGRKVARADAERMADLLGLAVDGNIMDSSRLGF